MKVNCPYCNHEQEAPNECNEEDELYESECKNCGKYYGVSPFYIKDYRVHKMPCWNGTPHEYEKIQGYPEELFANRRRCNICREVIYISKQFGSITEQR